MRGGDLEQEKRGGRGGEDPKDLHVAAEVAFLRKQEIDRSNEWQLT